MTGVQILLAEGEWQNMLFSFRVSFLSASLRNDTWNGYNKIITEMGFQRSDEIMLTNENVLDMFRRYMEEDQALDVVLTRRGYTVMLWDYTRGDWSDVACCDTPEKLFDKLLDFYASYQEYKMLGDSTGYLSDKDRKQIQKMCLPFLEKRKEVEK